MYNKEYYQKNKEKALQWQREYRKKNRDSILGNRRRYDKENREHQLELKYQWRKDNLTKHKESKQKSDKKYRDGIKDTSEFKEKEAKRGLIYRAKPDVKKHISEYSKVHAQIPEVKERRNETSRIRNRSNPRSNRSGTIELQLAMNNVRIRDKQTCQWLNCKLTHREVPIHVHHIFPVSEYPDYEEIEQYMICYCANHHGIFHRYRGDKYANFIGSSPILNRGRN